MFAKNTDWILTSQITFKSLLLKIVWEYLDQKFGTVHHTTLNLQ